MHKIVFSNSGDEVAFNSCNDKLLEFYINSLNQCDQNRFFVASNNLDKNLNALQESINQVNLFLRNLTDNIFKLGKNESFLDQQVLNRLHEQYVFVQKESYNIRQNQTADESLKKQLADVILQYFNDDEPLPVIADILHKLNYWECFSSINTNIHLVEKSFNSIRYQTSNWFQIPNLFNKSLVNNSRTQLSMPFAHLGRSLYNKFLTYDDSLIYKDENNFDELLGIVEINLEPTQNFEYSNEYLLWCKNHKRVPTGQYISLGEFPNLNEKLLDYRTVLHRNIMQNNYFHIQ